MGWYIVMILIIVFLFIVWAFCKTAGDSDDESEEMWEQYLRDKKLEIKDEENTRFENERNERNERLDREDEESYTEKWKIWKEEE